MGNMDLHLMLSLQTLLMHHLLSVCLFGLIVCSFVAAIDFVLRRAAHESRRARRGAVIYCVSSLFFLNVVDLFLSFLADFVASLIFFCSECCC